VDGVELRRVLKVLSEGLVEFPRETELLKLQEMARHDLEDLQKQRQLGSTEAARRQEFAQRGRSLTPLANHIRRISAVANLRMLVLDGEKEQQSTIRFGKELSDLRTLLSDSKFGEAVRKGEALLREYPEEFELKELVGYARSEATQQETAAEGKGFREANTQFHRPGAIQGSGSGGQARHAGVPED